MIVVSLTVTACTPARFATLDGVIKGERRASGKDVQLLRIESGDETPRVRFGMELDKGDRIVTAPGVTAVITFADGWRVILEPGSELEIHNPIIFLRTGKAVVAKLRRIREMLKVQTEYTTAAPEGTLFKIEVRGDDVTFKVVEGQLRVFSQQETSAPIVFRRLQQGTVLGSTLPGSAAALDRREAREIIRIVGLVNNLFERRLRIGVSSRRW